MFFNYMWYMIFKFHYNNPPNNPKPAPIAAPIGPPIAPKIDGIHGDLPTGELSGIAMR